MEKKTGAKKKIAITVTAVLLTLSALLGVLYHNYTKEICVIEPVEHMEQLENVSMENLIIKMEYHTIDSSRHIYHCLYVFSNGDIYSGDCNYNYQDDSGEFIILNYEKAFDERYWEYVDNQQYLGRLSKDDLEGLLAEMEGVTGDDDTYHSYEPQPMGAAAGSAAAGDTNIVYFSHVYEIYYWEQGVRNRLQVSYGESTAVVNYSYNIPSHNAIDIIKSTWAYGQWTNQIFGEGWEERIDLKDELPWFDRETDDGGQWKKILKTIWNSILSLFPH